MLVVTAHSHLQAGTARRREDSETAKHQDDLMTSTFESNVTYLIATHAFQMGFMTDKHMFGDSSSCIRVTCGLLQSSALGHFFSLAGSPQRLTAYGISP